MSEQTAVRTREKWVDDVKVIACILVVLGHFLARVQSYAPGGVLYEWFHKTIYYFHVPLFFIFLVTPTFSTVKMTAVGLAVAIAAKAYILTGGYRNICCIDCSYK